MSAVCGAKPAQDDKGKSICKACPAYTTFGKDQGSKDSFVLRRIDRGAFTAPKPQALAVMDGCEPHAADLGGTVLLERTDRGWQRLGYFVSFMPSKCVQLAGKDGAGPLVCSQTDVYNGGRSGTGVELVRFKGQTLSRENLLKGLGGKITGLTSGMSDDLCWDWTLGLGKDVAQPERAVLLEIQGSKRQPNDDESGSEICEGDNGSGEKRSFSLRYLFDGAGMTLDPKSQGQMSGLRKFLAAPKNRE
ncbi:MAG: hypothetical protein NTY77_02725 [Elusimicrobia bacterium]|nr:hypothetical protein [Elusimicrobiota bacterium]